MKLAATVGSVVRWLMLACALGAVAACSDSDKDKHKKVVDQVTLNVATAAVGPGGSVTFVATVVGGNKADPTVTWSVDAGTCGA